MNLKELSYVQKNSFIWFNVYEVLGKAEKNSDRKQISDYQGPETGEGDWLQRGMRELSEVREVFYFIILVVTHCTHLSINLQLKTGQLYYMQLVTQ